MKIKFPVKNLFRSPLFWIILFFILRLYGITNPPLEVGHNWRQTTGLMVARNFLEVDNNILYPRIDINEGKTGIIGMEFPILNYIHYLVALVFGYEHWYGRLINLLVSSIGIFFFANLIERLINKKTALYSCIILLCSIWFAFSRKMMPDTFSTSLSFIGIFYAYSYIKNNKWYLLLLAFIFFTLGVLSKIPAGIYYSLLLFVFVSDKIGAKQKIAIGIASILSLCLVYFWYFQWNSYLETTYGNWYNIGGSFKEGFLEIYNNIGASLKNFYFNSFQSYVLFFISFIGIFLLAKNNEKRILLGLLSILFIYFIYVLKSGFFFHHHNYYIIPIVPVFSILAAYSLSKIKKQNITILLLSFGIIEAVANQSHDFRIKDSNKYKMEIESVMNKISSKEDIIAINTGANPQQMYLSHRKGFVFENDELKKEKLLSKLESKNCKFVVLDKHLTDNRLHIPIAYEDENYLVYLIE